MTRAKRKAILRSHTRSTDERREFTEIVRLANDAAKFPVRVIPTGYSARRRRAAVTAQSQIANGGGQ